MESYISQRLKFSSYQDKQILSIDLSNCNVEQAIAIIEEAKKIICEQPECSLLILTNMNNPYNYTPELFNSLKRFVIHNTPYVKASAILGASGLQKILINAFEKCSGRHFTVFDNVKEAQDWLVTR